MQDFNLIKFSYPVLKALNEGRLIRKFMIVLFRVIGVLAFMGSIIVVITVLKNTFDHIEITRILSDIFSAVLILLAGWILLQVHFFHAEQIDHLTDSPFTIIPIVSIFIRTIGEVYATIILLFGIIVSFTGGLENIGTGYLGGFIPYHLFSGGGGIIGSLITLFSALIVTILVLFIFYFFAELVVVGADIAINIRNIKLSEKVEIVNKAESKEVAAETPVRVEAKEVITEMLNKVEPKVIVVEKPQPPRCSKCGNIIGTDDVFCMNCGNKLK